jgi:hypothetical protein
MILRVLELGIGAGSSNLAAGTRTPPSSPALETVPTAECDRSGWSCPSSTKRSTTARTRSSRPLKPEIRVSSKPGAIQGGGGV